MSLLRTPADLAAWTAAHPGAAFVPTMGALHAGHAALIRQAAATARPTLVSIFVNPTQFNDPADFARYPKTLDADLALSLDAGAAAIWAPSVDDIYPAGPAAGIPPLPAVALFGEKDWQQLRVIAAMTANLAPHEPMPTIIPGPTIREPDGLAMSSRNRFLPPDARTQALAISQALRAAAALPDPAAAEARMLETLAAAHITPQYAVVRDAQTLLTPTPGLPTRRLIAAQVGPVRLIDNL